MVDVWKKGRRSTGRESRRLRRGRGRWRVRETDRTRERKEKSGIEKKKNIERRGLGGRGEERTGWGQGHRYPRFAANFLII